MTSISEFRYQTLHHESKSIRLINLLREGDASSNSPIECDLTLSYLGNTDSIYDAVSYSWSSQQRTASININGALFTVTAAVQDILRQLRLPDADRLLWIDLICINQSDLDEKAHQIQYMKEIFSQARSVIVSLGPHHVVDQRKSASLLRPRLDALRYSKSSPNLQKQSLPAQGKEGAPFLLRSKQEAFKLLDSQWAAMRSRLHWTWNRTDENNLLALLNHRWFTRVWVVQEVHAAKKILIICGDSMIDGKHIGKLHDPEIQRNIKSNKIKAKLKKLSPLLEYMYKPPPEQQKDYPDLLTILQRFRHLESTLPHDKIYALLALSRDGPLESGIEPNYTITATQLYQNVAKYMILRYRQPTLLTYIGYSTAQNIGTRTRMSWLQELSPDFQLKEKPLPSWCPDWQVSHSYEPQIVDGPDTQHHHHRPWFYIDKDARLILRMTGLGIGYVANIFSEGQFEIASPWSSKMVLTSGGTQLHRVTMHLQTIYKNRKTHGLDVRPGDRICLFLDSSGIALLRPSGKRYELLLLEHSVISQTIRRTSRNGPVSSTATPYEGDDTYDSIVKDVVSWIAQHDRNGECLEEFDIE